MLLVFIRESERMRGSKYVVDPPGLDLQMKRRQIHQQVTERDHLVRNRWHVTAGAVVMMHSREKSKADKDGIIYSGILFAKDMRFAYSELNESRCLTESLCLSRMEYLDFEWIRTLMCIAFANEDSIQPAFVSSWAVVR
jgi:hypothetical protein